MLLGFFGERVRELFLEAASPSWDAAAGRLNRPADRL
jgi:hypothetical protein